VQYQHKQLLRSRTHLDTTVHGLRSSFRDWTAERTNFPREVCEMALAHSVGNAVEAAYRRGDLFEKRRKLMLAWSSYVLTVPSGKVLAMRRLAS
jgi:integrase